MTPSGISDTDARVLQALPMNCARVTWPATARLAEELGLAADVVTSVLGRLRGRDLVEHDGGWPRRWARLPRADHVLEMVA